MTVSTPNKQGGDKINMGLLITSSSSSSINLEEQTNKQDNTYNDTNKNTNNYHENQHHGKIMTLKEREMKFLQEINSSNANDNNDNPPGNNPRNIEQLKIQSRATNTTTRNNYNNKPRIPVSKIHYVNTEQNQETNAGRAKNIEEWKAIFNKARENISKPQEQTKTTPHYGIQPTIMPIKGNETFGDIMDKINQDNTFQIYFQNVNGLAVSKGTRKWEDIIQEMTTRQVSVCGFAETNT
jgi:hypothetical protein